MPSETEKKPKKPSRKPRPCLRRRATKADSIAVAEWPISEEEMCKRHELYFRLTPTEFAREFSDLWDRPATLHLDGKTHTLQFNFCTNPLCEHFGLPQAEFPGVVGKPSRYNLKGTGGAEQHNSRLKCKKIAGHSTGICLGNTSDTLSNWSAALEIARLATIDRVIHPEPEYEFHREDCEARDKSPLTLSPKERRKFFHKRGRSTANCVKYQCRSCGKITSVLPSIRRNLTYLQKKSDLNVRFAEALVNKTAIIRLCEMLHLSPGSYYSKLKWLYLRCLEFLDRYERQGFEQITLDEAWLNVDSLVYRLNQSRRRGEAKGRSKYPVNAPWLQTHLVTVAEGRTYYCLRADLAYDSEADLKEIDRDTVAYRDDHLHNFCRKNDRFERWSVTPQWPADYDPESTDAYRAQLREMELRQRYVEGLHTNPTYTCLASLWLVKHLLKARKWRIVTDDDSALLSAIPRAFASELKERAAHLFVCKIQQRTKKTSRQKGAAKETGEQKEPPAAEPVEVLKADRKTKFLQYIESRRRLAKRKHRLTPALDEQISPLIEVDSPRFPAPAWGGAEKGPEEFLRPSGQALSGLRTKTDFGLSPLHRFPRQFFNTNLNQAIPGNFPTAATTMTRNIRDLYVSTWGVERYANTAKSHDISTGARKRALIAFQHIEVAVLDLLCQDCHQSQPPSS